MKKLSACIIALVALPLAAGRSQNLRTRPGGWAKSFTQGDASASQRAVLEKTIQSVIALLKSAPSVAHPVGFCISPLINVNLPETKGGPNTASLIAMALNHSEAHHECINPNYMPITDSDDRQTMASFDVTINSLRALIDGAPVDSDAAGYMYAARARVEDFAGFPAYAGDNGDVNVFITKRPMPAVLPVSRERMLNTIIAADRKTVANLKSVGKSNPYVAEPLKVTSGHLASMEKMLAGMSPAERAKQANLKNAQSAEDPFEGGADRPMVSFNPAFFDRTRPATDVQTIVVRIPAPCNDGDETCALSRPFLIKALKELDWHALAALVR